MLGDKEQAAFKESVEKIRALAASHLEKTTDVVSVVRFVKNLHRGIDTVALQRNSHEPKAECRAGCAYCCSAKVEATEPEIFLILQELRTRPDREIDALIGKLKKRLAEKVVENPGPHRPNCVFLENNLCSIYEVRPAVCRRAHSLSVESCRTYSTGIPQNLELVLDADALIHGTSAAYLQNRLASSAHELSNAVLRVLTDENSELRWYRGGTPFSDEPA
jgi:Fe-S-cluster containining protein